MAHLIHDTVQELLDLQARQRTAHLTADAASLVELFADDFVSISHGQVSRPSREESLERFHAYLTRVTFLAWDDVTEPQIRVADDGRLATVIVHKRVQLQYQGAAGELMEEETVFVWQETYLREQARWRLAVVVSTNGESVRRQVDGGESSTG